MITLNNNQIAEVDPVDLKEFFEINANSICDSESLIRVFFTLSRLEMEIKYFHPEWMPKPLSEKIFDAIETHQKNGEVSQIERSSLPAHGATTILENIYSGKWMHLACFGYWGKSSLYNANKHCLELFYHDGMYFLVDQYEQGSQNRYWADTTILCKIIVDDREKDNDI